MIVGDRDGSADWEPVASRAREWGATVETIPADHFFAGYRNRVGEAVASYVAEHVRE